MAILLPALLSGLQAQDSLNIGAWGSLAISTKLLPGLKISLEAAARTGFQPQDHTFFGQFGAKWQLTKHIYLSPRLRVGYLYGPTVFQRWFVALGHSFEPERFTITSRLAFQYRVSHYTDFDVHMHRDHWRWRSGLGYDIPHWKADPEVEIELFAKLNRRQPVEMDLLRVKLGTELSLYDHLDGKLFTLWDLDPSSGFGLDRLVLGFELGYKLARKAKTES
ncbi:MAG: DUF2490 domain-containing protein [Bacteroidetes bacterium]|nr:DUF2490 domain-containing protein [Bacteroidota bacterium]